MGGGLQTEFGILSTPGARVAAYVRSSGPQSGDDKAVTSRLFSTLNAGLNECRPNMGDVVFVLPGHAENISSASAMSNLVSGCKVIGLGQGALMPKLTWTANVTLAFTQSNVTFDSLRLNFSPDSGTLTVNSATTFTNSSSVSFKNCEMRQSVSATSLCQLPITLTTCPDFEFDGNTVLGATTGPTTGQGAMRIIQTNGLRFRGNFISVATSGVAVGAICFTTLPSTDIQLFNNVLQNRLAASTHALTGLDTCTGWVDHLLMMVNSGIAGANTVAGLHFGRQCYVSDGGGTRAALFGTEST